MLKDFNGLASPAPFEARPAILLGGEQRSSNSTDYSTSSPDFVTIVDVAGEADDTPEVEDVDRFITFRTELIAPKMLRASNEELAELPEDDLMFEDVESLGIGRLTSTMRQDPVEDLFPSALLPLADSGIESGAEDYRVEQYAHSVLDFSSQYGIDLSISYTAPNITGQPTIYPECGDFPQTFAMASTIVSNIYNIWANSQ